MFYFIFHVGSIVNCVLIRYHVSFGAWAIAMRLSFWAHIDNDGHAEDH